MTLYRQILLLLIAVSLVSLAAVLTLNLKSSSAYMQSQQQAATESALTSLGMRLAPVLQPYDKALAETTLLAAFDGAFYRQIEVLVYENDERLMRENLAQPDGVPQWFTNFFEIVPAVAAAPITNGWNEVAFLKIEAHPGFIQSQLWNLSQRLFLFYGVLFLVVAALAAFVLHRLVYRPLNNIEHQARAIENKDFSYRIPTPATRELKQVVQAMNHLTDILNERFSSNARQLKSLRLKVQQDAETEVANRLYFQSELDARLTETSPMAVILLSLLEKDKIRKKYGYQSWLNMLKACVETLRLYFEREGTLIGRLSETDFAVLVPVLPDEDLSTPLANVADNMSALHDCGIAPLASVAIVAGVLTQKGELSSGVMTRLDQALRDAQRQGLNPSIWVGQSSDQPLRSGQQWVSLLRHRLRDQELELSYQPLVNELGGEICHQEVYARLLDEQGHPLNAGLFIPVIEQFDLGSELDRAVLLLVLAESNANESKVMNVSLSSLKDTQFLQALIEVPVSLRARLIFEVAEIYIQRDIKAVESFVAVLRSLGFGFGIDNLGQGNLALDYVSVLRPNYVKLAPAICRQVDEHNISVITAIANTVGNLNIPLYATNVETETQLQLLQAAGINGFQGFINPTHID